MWTEFRRQPKAEVRQFQAGALSTRAVGKVGRDLLQDRQSRQLHDGRLTSGQVFYDKKNLKTGTQPVGSQQYRFS
jgi:hypothetical protein